MNFKDCLKRYHISPLQYSDGKELEEDDYAELYKLLVNYAEVDKIDSSRSKFNYNISSSDIDKVNFLKNNSLLDFDKETAFDILNKIESSELVL